MIFEQRRRRNAASLLIKICDVKKTGGISKVNWQIYFLYDATI